MKRSFSHDLWNKRVTIRERRICSCVLTSLLWFVTMQTTAFIFSTWFQEREKWHLLDWRMWPNTESGCCPRFYGRPLLLGLSHIPPLLFLTNNNMISLLFTSHLWLSFLTLGSPFASFDIVTMTLNKYLNIKMWIPTHNLFSFLEFCQIPDTCPN